MAMTPGANRSKQAQIYKLMQQGYDADQISRSVKVYKDCVEHFMEHFKTSKHLPQTSAFAAIKEGMPRLEGHGRVSGLQNLLESSEATNAALTARIDALEAKLGGTDLGDDDGLG